MESNERKKQTGLLIAILAVMLVILAAALFILFRLVSEDKTEAGSAQGEPSPTARVTGEEPTRPEATEPDETKEPAVPTAVPEEPGESVSQTYATGDLAVRRGRKLAAQVDEALVYYEDGQEKWRITGAFSPAMLMTDDTVYYCSGQNKKVLCASSLEDGIKHILNQDVQIVDLLGIYNQKLYTMTMMDENSDEKQMTEIDLTNGSARHLPFGDMWGDVGAAMYEGKIFYTGGVSDVSPTVLYEADPQTGATVILDESCTSELFSRDGKIYFSHVDAIDDNMVHAKQDIREMDPETKVTRDLIAGSYGDLGYLHEITEDYFVLVTYGEGQAGIRLWNRKEKSWESIPPVNKEHLDFLNESDGKYYFYGYNNQEAGETVYSIYEYSPETKELKSVAEVEGYPFYTADGYVYHSRSSDEWNVYIRTEYSIV